MTENRYRATISKVITPRCEDVEYYGMSVIGISKFECDIETNDLELLNELTKVLIEFAERKVNELPEKRGCE